MQQASCKCETPQLELKSLRTSLAIKRFQRTKIKKVINRSRISLKSWAHMCTHRGKAVKENTTYLENFNTISIANNVRMTKIDQDRDLFSPFNATGTGSSVLLCHL